MHISLAPEIVFYLGSFPVTNSLLASLIVSVLMMVSAVFFSVVIRKIPSRAQNALELIVTWMGDLAVSVGGAEAKRFLPLVVTLFLYILFSNWIGLVPGFGSIGINKIEHGEKVFVPILRGATADLNTTLALALISVGAIQFYGISRNKLVYFKRFFNFDSPIYFFTGILELISEFAKIISFSFRLFGNVFAGEVLLAVISSLVPVVASLPFFGLEIFVGLIQALVFAMLTLVFIQMGTVIHGKEVEHGV
jgi:F-type H+-transporting ATPase subunit a